MALNGLFPTTDYADDQPLSRTILTGHVVHRGIPIGTVISSLIPLTSRYILRRPSTIPLSTRLLHSTSTGVIITTGLMIAMTFGRMQGRDEIEWKDRSWRLLRNEGQTELDDYSAAGGALGAIVGAVRHGSLPLWRGAVGGLGYGMLAGTAAFAISKIATSSRTEKK